MTYTGPVYRPPVEAQSLLIQVTVGCAHNKCSFCTMYRDTLFSVESIDRIEKDLKEARSLYSDVKRVFLVNGDAFVLSGRRLKEIARKVIEYLPEVEVITMYASINNIKTKTDDELRELRELRINELWIGVETADGDTLRHLNKGFDIKDSRRNLKRLNQAGIDFYYGFMFGASGKGKGLEAAEKNAELINEVKPIGLAPTTLNANEQSPLYTDIQKGKFEPATERELFAEMKRTIELIDVDQTVSGHLKAATVGHFKTGHFQDISKDGYPPYSRRIAGGECSENGETTANTSTTGPKLVLPSYRA